MSFPMLCDSKFTNSTTLEDVEKKPLCRQFNFTKRSVSDLLQSAFPCALDQLEYSDIRVRGLKLIRYPSGIAVWYSRFQHRGIKYSERLGQFPALSVSEARMEAQTFRLVIERGEKPKPKLRDCIGFIDYMESIYLPHSASTKAEGSYRSDASKVRVHFEAFFGRKVRLVDTDGDLVERYLMFLKRTLAASTLAKHWSLLSAAFRFAIKEGYLEENPCSLVPMPSAGPQAKLEYLDLNQIAMFTTACQRARDPETGMLLLFLLATGLRIGEALNARFQDYDQGAQLLFLPTTKSGRSRYLPLNRTAQKVVELQRQGNGGNGFLFQGRDASKPMSRRHKAITAVFNDAGLPGYSPHSLRKTYTSQLVMSGVDIFTASKLIGHSTVRTTERFYAHLNSQALASASGRMADLIQPHLG